MTDKNSNSAAAGAGPAPGSDEAIMRTRLLFDGDGAGDDRRLNLILKMIIKFCSTSPDSAEAKEGESEIRALHDKIVAYLELVEWNHEKSKLVQTMNQVEYKNYESIYRDIEVNISKAKEDIARAKVELAEARKFKKNKMEYEKLAKIINQNPDRETSSRKLAEVQADLAKLRTQEDLLDQKLEMRKKQFHVLAHSIRQLQMLVDSDRDDMDMDLPPEANKDDGHVSNSSSTDGDEGAAMDAT